MMVQTETGALLHTDHVATIQALQTLEGFLARNARKAPDAAGDEAVRKALQSLIDTLSNEVGRHFGFEEEHLFPLLAERGEAGIGEFLKQEHATILPLAEEVAATARTALAQGFTDESWRRFHAAGLELVEREIFHIQKEEMGLLAAISMLVDPAADRELAERFRGLQAA
jgi:iron-sulfur cluster repair protein YtfE (RIC family)